METLEFTPGLQLGIETIDREHAEFFDLMNQLVMSESGSADRSLVAEVLNNLESYVATHFAHEEELMARFDFAELAEHQALHIYFAQQVSEFRAKYEAGDIGLEDEMMSSLVAWFTQHVMQEDMKYLALFRANGL